jgi:hypothetical protein
MQEKKKIGEKYPRAIEIENNRTNKRSKSMERFIQGHTKKVMKGQGRKTRERKALYTADFFVISYVLVHGKYESISSEINRYYVQKLAHLYDESGCISLNRNMGV